MTLRKVTIDNSVEKIPKSEQTREFKQNTIKSSSPLKKRTKTISQNNKKFFNNVAAQGIAYLK